MQREILFETQASRLRAVGPTPVTSSADLGWEGFLLERHRLPAIQSEAVRWLNDTVIVQRGNPITLEVRHGETAESLHVLPGMVTVRPADYEDSARCADAADFATLSFTKPFMIQACLGMLSTESTALRPGTALTDRFAEGVVLALETEALNGGLSGRLYRESLANSLALHLVAKHSNGTPITSLEEVADPPRKIRDALDFIHANLHRDISLTEIAAAVQLSPFHFSRTFKQNVGVSPYHYVIRQRIEKAKLLLLQRDLPLTSIALDLGFYDQSHFTRHFKRLCHMTPRAFAERVGGRRHLQVEHSE